MASLTEKQIGPGPVPVWDMQTASAGQIDACCGLGKGVNLFRNWYFVGGGSQQGGGQFPINQMGQTEYGGGYTIDGWISNGYNNGKVTLVSNGLVLAPSVSLDQRFENLAYFYGKTVVLSVLTNLDLYSVVIVAVNDGNITQTHDRHIWLQFGVPIRGFRIANVLDNGEIFIAAKLELGSEQTLAVKDGNGDWVLADPIPHSTLELLKCQRYFQTFATQSLRPVEAEDFRPVMRAKPTLGTITVGGKTLYTASADL